MRLTHNELIAIREEIFRADPLGKIYLFGSRVDDNRRGGDIDLFVESSFRLPMRDKLLLEHRISSACDMKIDLLFKSPEDEDAPIYEIAREGIRL